MVTLALSTPQLNVPGAGKHAEICSKTQSVVGELIKKDAEEHHVYFIVQKGFHNHLVHALLAGFSLGADEARLREVFKLEAATQAKKLPPKEDFKWDSKHCLGNDLYYTNYLDFFLGEIELKGSIACIEEYIFKDRVAEMYSRFLVGAYHPIIHVGMGVEFAIPLLVAEGLAQTAIHRTLMETVLGNEPLKGKAGGQQGKHETALEIIKSTLADKRFDGIVPFKTNGKIKALCDKVPDVVKEYVDRFVVNEQLDGPEGLRARATELQNLGAVLCCACQPEDKQIHLDFFLMHILTSSQYLHCFVEALKPEDAASLLRGVFAADFSLYVSFNRPAINMEQFKTYPKKSWDEITKAGIAHNEAHLPKAIRAIKHAHAYDKTIDDNTYRAMAQMIVDGDAHWSVKEVGFPEAWENIPARGVPYEKKS